MLAHAGLEYAEAQIHRLDIASAHTEDTIHKYPDNGERL
jgi:hypothetical protein